MNVLSNIPAFIRILIVFAVILIGINRKLALGHCFSMGAFALGVLFGMNPVAILNLQLLRYLIQKPSASPLWSA